ncbi:hypothetical protein [Clostridium thermarum]|uniref:hypothetical protein n=1 Tax=Clostridium thermarum TaxID=1716543 RepID=UPI0013D0AF45|nr:hypothetical protein [Clostridium thermarum]
MNKKLLSGSMALALGICILTTSTPVYAWGGYTHHYMAMKKSEGFLHAPKYRGGALFADIGRLSWDSKYTVSDSAAFDALIGQVWGPYSDAEKSSINQVLQDVINRTSVFYSSNSLVKSSISYASIYEDQGAVSADNETSKTKNQKLDKLKKEKLKKSCNQVLDEIINEKLATLEKEYVSDDVYNITYKIQNQEKYKNKLTKLRNIAEENTTTLEEILE